MPKVASLLTTYENERKSEVRALSKLRSAAKPLRRILGKVEASQLWRHITRYRNQRLAEGVTRPTIRRELGGVLVPALKLAWRSRRIRNLPYIPLPARSQPRPWALTPREVRRLLSVIREQSPLGLFVYIALLTGARLSAILDLEWDRVDFSLNQIDFNVDHPLLERMKKRAIVPLFGTLRRVLRKARTAATGERVVGVSARTIQRHFAEAVKAAGLPPTVTPHVLRHTAITFMIRGANLLLASRTAGHTSCNTTQQNYEHLLVGDLKPAMRAVDRRIFG